MVLVEQPRSIAEGFPQPWLVGFEHAAVIGVDVPNERRQERALGREPLGIILIEFGDERPIVVEVQHGDVAGFDRGDFRVRFLRQRRRFSRVRRHDDQIFREAEGDLAGFDGARRFAGRAAGGARGGFAGRAARRLAGRFTGGLTRGFAGRAAVVVDGRIRRGAGVFLGGCRRRAGRRHDEAE